MYKIKNLEPSNRFVHIVLVHKEQNREHLSRSIDESSSVIVALLSDQ